MPRAIVLNTADFPVPVRPNNDMQVTPNDVLNMSTTENNVIIDDANSDGSV